MEIPSRLQNLLSESDIQGPIYSSISEFEPWISVNKLVFFPEYTDHGIKHIEGVLQTTEALIRDEAWEVFSTADAGAIVLASILHDSAMHLTPDSFVALVGESNKEYRIMDFDKCTWHQLWNDFLTEALRFDGRKLVRLFGNTDPVHVPPVDPDEMSERDHKLIGEFLRRYHHRLAHEIALFGVPSLDNNRIRLDEKLPMGTADLVGLITRGHGLPIRSCFSYLESKHALCEYKQTHAVFLMALLRIADYLQIQPRRAPTQILNVMRLRSPVSKGEWDFHHAIETIEYHDDPESLLVIASPRDINTFLKIKDWLIDFQSELDTCWAILGEVYGPRVIRGLNKLGFVLRRIRSNLDEIDTFSKTVEYIPTRAVFKTADPSVLNLLVGPLYNDDPAFAVRELVQNAVDAVRELHEYQKHHKGEIKKELLDQEADVVVAINRKPSGELCLTVSDRGIGMTADVIRDYFLCAGASFRESEVWRKEFTGPTGRTSVLRSGRFGIGVLAAFLIGNEIRVSTRYVNSPEDHGIEFTATLDTDTIELKRKRLPVGTEICIKIFEKISEKYNRAKWESAMDWYYLSEPSVRFEVEGVKVEPKYKLPSPNLERLPTDWRRTEHPDYQDIHWTYSNAPAVSCNGLKVIKSKTKAAFNISPQDDITGSIRIPNLSIFDPDGKLPLNLQRTDLKEDIPFEQELQRDILKDFLSFVMVYAPTLPMTNASMWDFYQYLPYPGMDTPVRQMTPWFCTQHGVSILDSWHIANVRPKSAIAFFLNSENELLKFTNKNISTTMMGLQWPPIHRYFDRPSSPFSILCSLLLREPDPELHRIPSISGTRIFFSRKFISSLQEIAPYSVYGKKPAIIFEEFISKNNLLLHSNCKLEKETNNWCLFSIGDCNELSVDLQYIIKEAVTKPFDRESTDLQHIIKEAVTTKPFDWKSAIIAEWYFNEPKGNTQLSALSKAWIEIIRDPIIPYDIEERRKKLTHAFKYLDSYIKVYEQILKEQQQKENRP